MAGAEGTDALIFLAVVALRFGIPLLIPRFPLPAIVAALVLDAADQTIFQQFTDLNLDGYQSYDKALDVYYLTIAYVSTLRNWGGGSFAGQVARFLWYYRLVGVVLFEYTQARWLLLVFPNTFEYYVIAIEAYRTRRNPLRLTHRHVLLIAGAIWVFIKLPQEWWIHVAQLDFTDFAKETVLGVTPEDSWGTALTNRPVVTALLAVGVVGLLFLARMLTRRLPAPDWARTFDADVVARRLGWDPVPARSFPLAAFGLPFLEKVALVGMIGMIFAEVLPGTDASPLSLVLGVAFLIAVNTVLSEWIAKREISWRSTAAQFVTITVVNVAVIGVSAWLLARDDDEGIRVGNAIFFAALLSLITVLYDRYRDIGSQRRVDTALPDAVRTTGTATPRPEAR